VSRLKHYWRWQCGIDLDRVCVGNVVHRAIKTDNSKVRRIR
jgi:hypothetical protein